MPRITTPGRQHFDRNGFPLAGGLLYTRETDGLTDKAVYPTQADLDNQTNAYSNPIELDSEGREPEMYGSGEYWFNLEDKNNVQIPGWPKSPVDVGASEINEGLFYGLTLSNNATDLLHDIDIATGASVDSTRTQKLTLSTALTKQLDATWAAGNDSGGRAAGVNLTAGTWYHVFLVVIDSAVDVLFDTSLVCANGIANNNVTKYAFINSIFTDASSNIFQFLNTGNRMGWDLPVNTVNVTDPGSTATDATIRTPTGLITMAELAVIAVQGSTGMGNIIIRPSDVTGTAPTSTVCDFRADTSITDSINKKVPTNLSNQVQYECSTGADGTLIITTIAWEVLR